MNSSPFIKNILLPIAIYSSIFTSNIVIAETCVVDKHTPIPSIYGLSYDDARKNLIASGWQPLINHWSRKDDIKTNLSYGNGLIFWERGYWEIEACSGTGTAACSFYFGDVYGNELFVKTVGEQERNNEYNAKVEQYRFFCPAPEMME